MSPMQKAIVTAQSAVTKAMGTEFKASRFVLTQYSKAQSDAAPPFNGLGVVKIAAGERDPQKTGHKIVTAHSTLWVAAINVAAMPWIPAKGDEIEMFVAGCAQRFAVSSALQSDVGDITFYMDKL